MTDIWVLHGPNLNMLGRREPEVYGTTTLDEIDAMLVHRGQAMGVQITCRQSNHEGVLIDWLQEAFNSGIGGLVINPGGLTHTSVALRDALAALPCPKIEVHLSNVWAREEFRHHSFVSPVVTGVIGGLGVESYLLGLQAVVKLVRK
ncbi:MAG: 3-dehydroquinate dehydratase [Cyanobacteria bacterium RYN_339]|nr:3-dehydroquinate dehydratase [Cyanobacteria bacterium RYN_339]